MPDLNKATQGLKPCKNNPGDFFPQGRILLLCAVVFCLATAWQNAHQPSTTYAVAPAQTEPVQSADAPKTQTNAAEASNKEKLAALPSLWPVNGAVTSGFGERNSPLGDGNEAHAGIDIAVSTGEPVVATADGKIVQSGPYGGYGNMVQIDHGNGIATIYGHNSRLAVSVGQTVKKGQVISYAGSTGKSTGPHVHYEVRVNDTAVDPWQYLVASRRDPKIVASR